MADGLVVRSPAFTAMHACYVDSVVSNSSLPHGLYVAHKAPLSMGLSRQE